MMVALSDLYGFDYIKASIVQLSKSITYLSPADQELIVKTCHYAAIAHEGQRRKSGEPYICHPIKVSEILAKDVNFGLPVLQAAILHDVIEDTPKTKDEIIEHFGQEVANLVDGVSKLEKDSQTSPELLQAQTFAKLVQAMEADPRVVMIKFADRIHNMQTLGALRPDKRRRIAQETLDVYVPIANHLGMFSFKTRLEELAFRNINPWRYNVISKLVKDSEERLNLATEVIGKINEAFKETSIQASVRKRQRNLLNVYKKLQQNDNSEKTIKNTSIPFIVLASNIKDCYQILGIIHQLFPPIFRKLTDYIASPKVNGYQSIHTSVLTKNRKVINFQIRTKDMHSIAESGIVAIWMQHNKKEQVNHTLPKTLKDKSMRRWLGNIKTLQSLVSDPIDYYEAVKRDLIGLDLQVFTPKGEAIALPKGATVIDFAYYIHTDIGNHLVSAKVNSYNVPVNYILSNGQTVELDSDSSAYPSAGWLKVVKTARARAAIRYFFRTIPKKELQLIGKKALLSFIKKQGFSFINIDELLGEISKIKHMSINRMMELISLDELSKTSILNQLQSLSNNEGFVRVVNIQVNNLPGALAKVAKAIGETTANIENIQFPDNVQSLLVTMIFSLRLSKIEQLDEIIDKLNNVDLVKNVLVDSV